MSLSTNFPTVNPTLNLNFLNAGVLDSRITFSRGSTATYFDQLGVLQTAASGVARFDYNPSTLAAQGLLIEEQRTNSLLQSQTFQTTWSALNVTVSTDTTTAPDGTTTADTLTPAASTAAHLISQSATVAASTAYSASVFVKTDGAPFVQVAYDNGASVGAFINVNLANGSITRGPEAAGGATNATGTVVAVGNGYYRISVGATHASTTGRVLISPLPAGQSAAGLNASTTTAATDKIIVWGAQLEAGAFPTSYIPTTTTALTRNADVASMTGTNFSSWFNASEGTVFVYSIPSNVTASNFANWAIGDSTLAFGAANTIYNLYTSGLTGRIGVNAITAGASQVSNLTPSYTQNANTPTKSAIAYKLNDYAHSVNGVAPATDTSATVPTVTSMSIGGLQSGWSGATNYLNGYIQRISYYPVRLSNTTLQALTV